MGLLCWMFGHQPPCYTEGSGGDYGQSRVRREGIDGCGREHARIEAECPRCNERYQVMRIHVPLPVNVTVNEQRRVLGSAVRVLCEHDAKMDECYRKDAEALANYVQRIHLGLDPER